MGKLRVINPGDLGADRGNFRMEKRNIHVVLGRAEGKFDLERMPARKLKVDEGDRIVEHEIEQHHFTVKVDVLPEDPTTNISAYSPHPARINLEVVTLDNRKILALVSAEQVYPVSLTNEEAAYYASGILEYARENVEDFKYPEVVLKEIGMNTYDGVLEEIAFV